MNPISSESVPPKSTNIYLVLVPLAFAAGLLVGYLFWGKQAAPVGGSEVAEQVDQPVTRYDVPVDDDPSLGPEDAKITIIEFSDYECPYCTKWHVEVWPRLQKAFPGDLRLVYRDFPLYSIHSNAAPAAEAANCAGEQDAYWQFHDKLFSTTATLGTEAFKIYAADLDLDLEKFEECLTSRRYKDEVEGDYSFAANLGVQSTPTFFINGIPIVGAQPFDVFKDVITKELAGEIP